jgi:transposase-like protein
MKGKHPTSNIEQPTSNGGAGGRLSAIGCWLFDVRCWMLFFSISVCLSAFGATNAAAIPEVSVPPTVTSENPREFYNAGTEKLRAGKLSDAEMLLESSLTKQDERVQPAALFNLGHVRFAQGNEELKKSPDGTTKRSRATTEAGAGAIQKAADALAGNDVQQMVEAYFAGRGVRKEMRAATAAVQRAMEAHGKTLLKWRRALSDFKSAAELNPVDTNAVRNAEIVEQAIAKLVDSMREMQQSAASLGGKRSELNGLLKQLKGRIPAPNAPPGAAGEEDDEDKDGEGLPPEALSGLQESTTGGGREMELKISPEEAGQLLNGIQPDGKLLPMGQGESGKPKDRPRRIW